MFRIKILNNKTVNTVIEVLFVFALIFIKFVSYGFKYYYQLDDYIQYHLYDYLYASAGDIQTLITQAGILGARPLAGISDIYIWSRFFDFMIAGVLIISLMYAVSAVLLKNIFKKYFDAGWFFIIVFALLPLGTEGIYWMSASTRVVCGIFYASVSAAFFVKYTETRKSGYIPLYAVAQLFAFGHYEQALVFSFVLTFMIAGLNILKSKSFKNTGIFTACISVFNAAVYFGSTRYFLSGLSMARTEIVLPKSAWYWNDFLPEVFGQMREVLFTGTYKTSVRGFRRGLYYIWHDNLWLFFAALVILLVLLFIYLHKQPNENISGTKPALTALFAVLLAITPLTPFLFIANPWFSFRNACACFAGSALLGDLVIRQIFRKKQTAVLSAAVFTAFVFCAAGVSEIRDYKLTYEYDSKTAAKISETLDKDGITADLRVGVLNLQKSYLDEQNFLYHEHIHGVTESSWALSGALISYNAKISGSRERYNVIPMPSPEIPRVAYPLYKNWNKEILRAANLDCIYYIDENFDLHPLYAERLYEEHRYILYYGDGVPCAEIWEEDGLGYIMMYNFK